MSSDDNETNDENTRRITLGKLVAYPTGLVLILAGLTVLAAGYALGGLLITIAGIVALPIVRALLKQNRDISISRGATVAIVFILLLGGVWSLGTGGSSEPTASSSTQTEVDGDTPDQSLNTQDTDSTSTQTATKSESLIQAPPEDLLPTIDDFDAGWQKDSGEDPNQVRFFNTESETVLTYNVTVHDSIQNARTELQNRRPTDLSTESVSVGNEGFLYKFDERFIIIQFRIQNVVGKVIFDGGPGVLTPETNAANFAQRLANSITDQATN